MTSDVPSTEVHWSLVRYVDYNKRTSTKMGLSLL